MKTKEELNALKEEVETLNKKLVELNEDELKQITGGSISDWFEKIGEMKKNSHNPATDPIPTPYHPVP